MIALENGPGDFILRFVRVWATAFGVNLSLVLTTSAGGLLRPAPWYLLWFLVYPALSGAVCLIKRLTIRVDLIQMNGDGGQSDVLRSETASKR
jgi:hypothetical protein